MPGAEALSKVPLDDSVDISLDKDDSEKEIEIISQGWNFIKSFLNNLEKRSKVKINKDSDDMIKDINIEIAKYVVKNEPNLVTNQLGKLTGTKPKLFKTNNSDLDDDDLDNKSDWRSANNIDSETLRILSRLDNRKLPKLDIYDEKTGMDFIMYLDHFEEYYADNFKGRKYLWISELKEHLSGRMLEVFNSIRQIDDSYDEVKCKLTKWYNEEKEIREDRARIKFERARKKESENALMFSNSLLALFRMAYPGKNHRNSTVLINKLKSCLSVNLRNAINFQMMNYRMKDVDMTWKDVQKVIRIYELQYKDEDRSDDDAIIINFKDKSRSCNFDSHKAEPYHFEKPPTYLNKSYQNNPNYLNNVNHRNGINYESNINYQSNANYRNDYRKKTPQFTTRPQFMRPQFTPRPQFMRPTFAPQPFTTTRFSPPPMRDTLMCEYCRKIGHHISMCRSRLNLCFICGLDNHRYRQCTRYQPRDVRRYSVTEPPVIRQTARTRRFSNSDLNLNQ